MVNHTHEINLMKLSGLIDERRLEKRPRIVVMTTYVSPNNYSFCPAKSSHVKPLQR
jgi:hypothetical protein